MREATSDSWPSVGRRWLVAGAGAAALSGAAGCIDTDAAVFVEATITNPNATLVEETLVSAIEGSLGLKLHLGPRASGPAQVGLGALSVTNAAGTATFVAPLEVVTSLPFPVTVGVDTDVDIAITFAAADNDFEPAVLDEICAAGAIVIGGALDDSLRGGPIQVASGAFLPTGCP
jgi:hypothetical protein